MRAAGWGRIVNMASLAGQQGGVTGGAHYAASKAGMIVLTKVLPRELAPDGVTVNAVAPAAIRTPVMEALGEQRIAELARGIPAGRVGASEEVASLAYLCTSSHCRPAARCRSRTCTRSRPSASRSSRG
jgi:3-oxoacyl-[acyl-carrier protein] reductase